MYFFLAPITWGVISSVIYLIFGAYYSSYKRIPTSPFNNLTPIITAGITLDIFFLTLTQTFKSFIVNPPWGFIFCITLPVSFILTCLGLIRIFSEKD